MAKKEEVEAKSVVDGLDLDDNNSVPVYTEVNTATYEELEQVIIKKPKAESDELVSCLTNKKITVRFIPKESGLINNPKHVFYGNMAENAIRTFTVPILESTKTYVNVLTNDEKNYLENIMGLEYNALSIYLRKNNFWENYQVSLGKGDTILNLADPSDYIKYKVLKANKDYIAGSLRELQDTPKATFQYVLVSEDDETKTSNRQMNATMEAYMEFGKYQDDADTLRVVVELIDGRPINSNTKIQFLQNQINKIIQTNPRQFLDTIQDKYLSTKVLIKNCVEAGLIAKRGHYYYQKSDNSPLCSNNEEPTLSMAAKYLNLPRNQEIKLMLEAKLNK